MNSFLIVSIIAIFHSAVFFQLYDDNDLISYVPPVECKFLYVCKHACMHVHVYMSMVFFQAL